MWRVQPEGQALVVPIPDSLDPTRALRSVERLLDKQPITRFPDYCPVGVTDKGQLVVRGLGHDTMDIQRFGGEIKRAWARSANWRRHRWTVAALAVGLLVLLLASHVHAGRWSPWESIGEVNGEVGRTALGSQRFEDMEMYGVEAVLVAREDGRIACGFRWWYLAEITAEADFHWKSMTNNTTNVTTYPLLRTALVECRKRVEEKLELPPIKSPWPPSTSESNNNQPRNEP